MGQCQRDISDLSIFCFCDSSEVLQTGDYFGFELRHLYQA